MKKTLMKKKVVPIKNGSTLILRIAILAFAAVIAGLCIFVLPAGILTDNTGLYRWILLGLYIPAAPFFMAIYQTMKLLDYIDHNTAFSDESVLYLKTIKHCGAIIAGIFSVGMPYIYYVADKDDAPGVVALGLVIVGASIAVAVFAAVLERLLQNAIDIKTENNLTV
jgi:MFS family permease